MPQTIKHPSLPHFPDHRALVFEKSVAEPEPCLEPQSTLPYITPRITGISRSRIFFRNVFRFNPSIAAALIWLPRVAASVSLINGRSTSAMILS